MSSYRFWRQFVASAEGTTTTVRSARWITASETLPSSRAAAVSPREPTTITSTSRRSACAMIVSATLSLSSVARAVASRPAARASSAPSLEDCSAASASSRSILSALRTVCERPQRLRGSVQHRRERLPDREHGHLGTGQQLTGMADRGLGVLRTVVGDQDHSVTPSVGGFLDSLSDLSAGHHHANESFTAW